MEQLWRDIVSAFRRLARTPLFTTFSIASLAIGIGATTAVASLLYATLLSPPDIVDADRAVNLYSNPGLAARDSIWFSTPDFEDLRAAQTSLEQLVAFARFREVLVAHGTGTPLAGELVTGEYFDFVGLPAAHGRLIQAADDRSGATPVIVLSDSFWKRRFGADPGVIGNTVRLNGHPFEIIGVASDKFRGLDLPKVAPTAAWVPLSTVSLLHGDGDVASRGWRWLYVRGRLKDGVTFEQAGANVSAVGRNLDRAYPAPGKQADLSRRWYLVPTTKVKMHESVDVLVVPLAAAIAVAMAMVFLVVCSNVANLALARGASRRHEVAVRLALGASRWRLLREQLIETLFVALIGLGIGLLIARAMIVRIFSQPVEAAPDIVVQFTPSLGGPALATAIVASSLACLILVVVPAISISRSRIHDVLAANPGGGGTAKWRKRRLLVSLQVSVSVVLLAAAAICIQQLTSTAIRDTGLRLERLGAISIDFGRQGRTREQARTELERIVASLRRDPDIRSAAFSSSLPLGISGPAGYVTTTDRDPRTWSAGSGRTVRVLAGSPDLIDVLGMRLLHGRRFTERDARDSLPVAVVSEMIVRDLVARGYIPSAADAIGRDLATVRQAHAGEPEPAPETRTIVGVVADTDVGSIGARRTGLLLVPYSQAPDSKMTIVAQASSHADAAIGAIQRAIRATDTELAAAESITGPTLGGFGDVVLRAITSGVSGLGLLALVLAMGGLYGVLSEVVLRRTREIGIRMALGATAWQIVRMIVWDGSRAIVWGLIVGLTFGAIVRMGVRPLFLRLMPAMDPITFLAVPALFVAAGLIACYFPARRASRVEPLVALRHD